MEKHDNLLKVLISSRPTIEKTQALKHINKSQAKIVSEIVVNVLYGVLPISNYYKRRLEPFKTLWKTLANSNNEKRRTTIITNSGKVLLLLKACNKLIKHIIENGVPENDIDTS
jgi:hypothetical protein